jgi:hypothetical protein
MEQRDYLQKQFDQLGKALANALSKLYGLNGTERLTEGMEIVNDVLVEQLDMDIESFLSIKDVQFMEYLLNERHVRHENLENLATTLNLLGKESKKGASYLKKALLIYEYLQLNSESYSYDRATIIARIKKELS